MSFNLVSAFTFFAPLSWLRASASAFWISLRMESTDAGADFAGARDFLAGIFDLSEMQGMKDERECRFAGRACQLRRRIVLRKPRLPVAVRPLLGSVTGRSRNLIDQRLKLRVPAHGIELWLDFEGHHPLGAFGKSFIEESERPCRVS